MVECFKTGPDGATVRVDAPEAGAWVSVVSPTSEERRWLLEDLGVVPEFVSAAFDDEETPHIDFDDDTGQTLVIVDHPAVEDPAEVEDPAIEQYDTKPLALLVLPARSLVVTVSHFPCETVADLAAGRVRQLDTRMRTRFLLQALLHVSQQYHLRLHAINRQFAKTDRQLRRSFKNSDLIKMLGLEKSLLYFSTSLAADEAALVKIETGRFIELYEDDQDLLEDVLIEYRQAIEMCSIYTSILTRTMDTFGSVISNNLNAAMRTLTIITVVLAIPTIVFSFYGMNVDLPFAGSWLLPTVVSVAAGAVVAVLLARSRFFR